MMRVLPADWATIVQLDAEKSAFIYAAGFAQTILEKDERVPYEYFDGSGYPDGLKGEEIPLMGRVLAVADTVDAMGADRPYRKGRTVEVIVEELKSCSGTQFDPLIVNAFLRTLKISKVA